jgi:hypothetical protein
MRMTSSILRRELRTAALACCQRRGPAEAKANQSQGQSPIAKASFPSLSKRPAAYSMPILREVVTHWKPTLRAGFARPWPCCPCCAATCAALSSITAAAGRERESRKRKAKSEKRGEERAAQVAAQPRQGQMYTPRGGVGRDGGGAHRQGVSVQVIRRRSRVLCRLCRGHRSW